MKIGKLVIAELEFERAKHARNAEEYRELTRGRRDIRGNPVTDVRATASEAKAQEYAVLLVLARAHNEDAGADGGPLPDRVARLLEQVGREEQSKRDGGDPSFIPYLTTEEIRMILRADTALAVDAPQLPDSFGEALARDDVMEWLLRGVDGLDSEDAVKALDAYAAAVEKRVRRG